MKSVSKNVGDAGKISETSLALQVKNSHIICGHEKAADTAGS